MAGYEHAIYQQRISRVPYLCASQEIRAGVRRAAGDAALNAPDQLAAILFGEVPVAVRRESGGRPWPGIRREAAA
jgi:hypothetical protein